MANRTDAMCHTIMVGSSESNNVDGGCQGQRAVPIVERHVMMTRTDADSRLQVDRRVVPSFRDIQQLTRPKYAVERCEGRA